MPPSYDAIVVGARCAGSPTAMLLARQGHRVLLVDRASFPSDTMSTHAELLAAALDRWLGGGHQFEEEIAGYQRARDEAALPLFELTCQLASMEPPLPPMRELLAAIHGNQEAMTGFVSTIAGTVPVPEFFGAANLERVMAAAGPATSAEG